MTDWTFHVDPARRALFLGYAADHNYQPGSGITNDQIHVMLQEMRDQADEIDQLRRDLNDANERALGPDERASAAIQVVEAILEWKNDPTKPDDVHWASVLDALKLWETVR
jgi:hypothetical protein